MQGHMGMSGEERVHANAKLGLDFEVFGSGCCGMAGSWGYEKGDHYDAAMKAGERVLLPVVRRADKATLMVTNGSSCRSQIEEATERRAVHLAQVIQMVPCATAVDRGETPWNRTREESRHGPTCEVRRCCGRSREEGNETSYFCVRVLNNQPNRLGHARPRALLRRAVRTEALRTWQQLPAPATA